MTLIRILPSILVSSALSLTIASVSAGAQAEQQYVFLGDMPYSDRQRTRLAEKVGPKILERRFPFVVHVGDIKAGGKPCVNAEFKKYRANINGLWQAGELRKTVPPVFYTPGDNDWTDCDRKPKSSTSKSEIGQLKFLRKLFFDKVPENVPRDWQYERQDDFPENAMWRHGGIQFVTLHMVGTNNGRQKIKKDKPKEKALKLVEARDRANAAWLSAAFTKAVDQAARAVIVATHADVTKEDKKSPCTKTNPQACDGHANFRMQLVELAGAFKKPVLLVHGSTHPYCLDRSFGGDAAPQLWRLNTIGDYKNPGDDHKVDATVVTVAPIDADIPFRVSGLLRSTHHPKKRC